MPMQPKRPSPPRRGTIPIPREPEPRITRAELESLAERFANLSPRAVEFAIKEFPRAGLNPEQALAAMEIGGAIRRIDGDEEIGVGALAEAVQYARSGRDLPGGLKATFLSANRPDGSYAAADRVLAIGEELGLGFARDAERIKERRPAPAELARSLGLRKGTSVIPILPGFSGEAKVHDIVEGKDGHVLLSRRQGGQTVFLPVSNLQGIQNLVGPGGSRARGLQGGSR